LGTCLSFFDSGTIEEEEEEEEEEEVEVNSLPLLIFYNSVLLRVAVLKHVPTVEPTYKVT
jgi:hypothetical protein